MEKNQHIKRPAEQHHFLPKNAYLKRFAIPERPSLIYQYQRKSEPVAIGIINAARERNLYLFEGVDSDKSTPVEAALGKLEDIAAPVLNMLEAAKQNFTVDLSAKHDLMSFIAFQAFRTPAQRDAIGELTEEMLMKMMRFPSPDGKSTFERTLDEVEKLHPELPKEGKEKVLQAFRAGQINAEVDPQFAMASAMMPAIDVIPYLFAKEMSLIKAPQNTFFITSDHPVILVRRKGVPDHLGGFAYSNIVFPVGRSTLLFLANPDQIPERVEDAPCNLSVRMATTERVDLMNKLTIQNAERFIFGPENSLILKQFLDESKPPQRFTLE